MDFLNAVTSTPNAHFLPIGVERNTKEVRVFDHKKREYFKTDSSLYLDFEIKGERMVSKLCNSTDSEEQESDVKNFKYIITDVNLVASSIKNLAYEACEAAEKISNDSSSKCFNGMRYLCSKVKENIERSDSAVTKLQSQGLPWVIKTFILSLLKIVDGWKCLNDVLDKQSDDNVKLKQTFHEWESVTKVMLYKIYKTYESLNEGLKGKRQVNSINVYKQMLDDAETQNFMAEMSVHSQMGNNQYRCVASELGDVKYSDATYLKEDLGKSEMSKSETYLEAYDRTSNVSRNLPFRHKKKSKKKSSHYNCQKVHHKK